jgi:hypothetical protein
MPICYINNFGCDIFVAFSTAKNAKNAKHDNRIYKKRKSTTKGNEFTETRLVFLCVPGAFCGFAVIFPEKLRGEGGEFVDGRQILIA